MGFSIVIHPAIGVPPFTETSIYGSRIFQDETLATGYFSNVEAPGCDNSAAGLRILEQTVFVETISETNRGGVIRSSNWDLTWLTLW